MGTAYQEEKDAIIEKEKQEEKNKKTGTKKRKHAREYTRRKIMCWLLSRGEVASRKNRVNQQQELAMNAQAYERGEEAKHETERKKGIKERKMKETEMQALEAYT